MKGKKYSKESKCNIKKKKELSYCKQNYQTSNNYLN